MKRSGKLIWWALPVLIMLGMSSCLKTEERLGVELTFGYMLQTNSGYIPQMRLMTTDAVQTGKCIFDGRTFTFEKLSPYWLELPNNFYNTLDTVPAGRSEITVVATNGKSVDLGIDFNAANKRIGDMNLTKFQYVGSTNSVNIELADSVENAKTYYLMIKIPLNSGYSSWVPVRLDMSGMKDLSATFNLDQYIVKDINYKFAIGAAYGTTIMVNENQVIYVKKGENAGFDNSESEVQ